MDMMGTLAKVMELVNADGTLDPGDQDAVVLEDAVVFVTMQEDRTLGVHVVAGEPKRLPLRMFDGGDE